MTGSCSTPEGVVAEFWLRMNANDWDAASELLHDDYVLDWPQSGERIRGREAFVAVNANYPAAGRWQMTIHRLLASGDEVVSDVSVTDGAVTGRAITFSTIRDGRILKQIEYWPDPFEAPDWRAGWVERV